MGRFIFGFLLGVANCVLFAAALLWIWIHGLHFGNTWDLLHVGLSRLRVEGFGLGDDVDRGCPDDMPVAINGLCLKG